MTDEERFWSYVNKTDSCWLWIKGVSKPGGYGVFHIGRRIIGAHRYSFFLTHGYWPRPMCLHSCDNPPCVNPKHLREGSHLDNGRDMATRQRGTIGEKNVNARLKKGQVIRIKQMFVDGVSATDIASAFGISVSHAYSLNRGRFWKHIE